MKRTTIAAVCALIPPVVGCDRPTVAPPMANLVVPQPAAVAWRPTLVEDGFMFRDEAAFRDYLRRSEVVVTGNLTSWDGPRGTLRVEAVILGRAEAELTLVASGGSIRPRPGQKVIALLWRSEGKYLLNSFCAASGLYSHTEPLAAYIRQSLSGRAVGSTPTAGMSQTRTMGVSRRAGVSEAGAATIAEPGDQAPRVEVHDAGKLTGQPPTPGRPSRVAAVGDGR